MSQPTKGPKRQSRAKLLAISAVIGALWAISFTSQAQEPVRVRNDKGEKAIREEDFSRRDFLRQSIELAGYTRPGTPEDEVTNDGKILASTFKGANVKKMKILGATIYFAVFKNTGDEGDTYGTGMTNFDRRFDAGRSFEDSYSPRLDKKAKFLYLYQIVSDRFLNSEIIKVKGPDKGGELINPVFDPNAKLDLATLVPKTQDIQQFVLCLLVDPRYLTSWGHFRDSGFVSDVVDLDGAGKPVKHVVDDGKKKVERDSEIRLAYSYLPAITNNLPYPAYKNMAKPISLGDLEKGFGVGTSTLNLKESKAYGDLKLVAGRVDKDDIGLASFVNHLLKSADAGRDPDFVQVNYPKIDPDNPDDPGIPGTAYRHFKDEVAYSVFRVTWLPNKGLKQGDRSVLVGFTTDLPPTFGPVREDNDKSAEAGKELQLSSNAFIPDDAMPAPKAAAREQFTAFYDNSFTDMNEFSFTQAGGGSESANGTVPTPTPPPPPASGSGGGGGGGGGSGLGGGSGGGGGFGGGFGMPGFGTGGFSRLAGVATGGGVGSGGGSGQGSGNGTQAQQGTQAGTQNQNINFNSTLTNQQAQAQAQAQLQLQLQLQQQQQQQQQRQNNHDHNHHHHHHGHVVPAPASLLLGLLGLPGLYFLRRRKTAV